MEASIEAHKRAGVEAPQIELVDAELVVGFWVCGEQHLETAIEKESIDGVGTNSTANSIGRFEDLDVEPAPVQEPCAREPSKPATDHNHVNLSVGHTEDHRMMALRFRGRGT